MVSRRELFAIALGILVVPALIGAGTVVLFDIGSDGQDGLEVEAYPVGPEKPSPLNASNVGEYALAYEERLLYNDLLASQQHSLGEDERVMANCTARTVSEVRTDVFRAHLKCEGGITDSSQLSESEQITYAATYQITENTTQQTELRGYPFDADRQFNNERRSAGDR
jgi:hypothetical protein